MKKIILLSLLFAVASLGALAQRKMAVPLRVVIPESSSIPEQAATYLDNKLTSIVTTNGVATDASSQFFITAKTVHESADVVGSAPTMYAVNLTIDLYIADIYEDKLLATTAFSAKGVGQSPDKAYIDAIKRMNVKSAPVTKFIDEGIAKIIAYYTSQGQRIIADAKSAAQMKEFDKAMWLLGSVPSVCGELYTQAQSELLGIYKSYVDYMGEKYLREARAIWAAGQNRAAAIAVGELLCKIEPDASCRPQVEKLYAEVKARIGEEWTLELKRYNDSVALEKQRIDAARQVGVAYGTHQQPTTTNIAWMR